MIQEHASLTEYLQAYGTLLGKQAEQSLEPLHVPGRDPVKRFNLLRQPFPGQAHVVMAATKALERQKSVQLTCAIGTGKSIMALATLHTLADGKPYRPLIFCPGHLVPKWQREIQDTIPKVQVTILDCWHDVVRLRHEPPTSPHYYIISRDRAKLGAVWKPVVLKRNKRQGLRCPSCGLGLCNKKGEFLELEHFDKARRTCDWVMSSFGQPIPGCGEQLWQDTRDIDRIEPAKYIHKHLKHYFDGLVIDEAHEEKSATSAQANAAGALIASAKKVITLTGTWIGGYAEHVRPMMFRMAAGSLREEGLGWSDMMAFNEKYGRIETKIIEKDSEGAENRQSRGGGKRVVKQKKVVPGIMPGLFGRHLIDKAIFLSLEELSDNLPAYNEEFRPMAMDPKLAAEYKRIEAELAAEISRMIVRGDRRLLAAMLQTLLSYPDHPYGFEPVGYDTKEGYKIVTVPKNLGQEVRAKETKLVEICKREVKAGRKCWVYALNNGEHDVQSRLVRLLTAAGLRVGDLRASVAPVKREGWIQRNGPNIDVAVSHPKLVETGLDFFDKKKAYNFPTIINYQVGYSLFTMRQASGRAWRIGQTEPCKTFYLYYTGTMQERAIKLMSKKLSAAQALEGKFSAEGLVALSGDESMELALARLLVDNIDVDARTWGKVK